MSNRNDKILAGAAVGLLVIATAVWIFILQPLVPGDREHDPRLKSQSTQLGGEVYPATPRADIFGFSSNWERPEEHDEGWNYDIFDPVETVWDEQLREYQPKSYTPPVIPPFGIHLTRLGHPHYPLILRGSIAPQAGKPETARILFIENVDTKNSVSMNIGKLNSEEGVTPLSYRTEKFTGADGASSNRNILRLKDIKLGKEIEIDDIKPVEFSDLLDIILVADSGAPSWTFHAQGATFEHGGATFVVKGVDLQAGSVTVDKTFTPNPRKGPKTLTETLVIAPAADPKSKNSTPSTATPKSAPPSLTPPPSTTPPSTTGKATPIR